MSRWRVPRIWRRLRLDVGLRAAACAALASPALAGCGADPEACEISAGSYHVVLPDGPAQGALVFLHGWGSRGAGTLRLSGMVSEFTQAGYAVIAPDGTPLGRGRSGRTWSFHPDWPHARDDVAFLQNVAEDAAERFALPRARMMLAGFSIGGSMTSYAACAAPSSFAAYAPVGGGFWRPHPDSCAGPVRLLHTHGWADGTVPLEGRMVRGAAIDDPGALVQGDMFHGMDIWRRANGCRSHMPQERGSAEGFWLRRWTECAAGSALGFALHPGGHSVPPGWAALALSWFEAELARAEKL